MTKHSKNNTASSIFSYAEYKKLDYGTKRVRVLCSSLVPHLQASLTETGHGQQRLGNESMRRFDACALCLQRARDPVACQKGHLFCRECVLTDLGELSHLFFATSLLFFPLSTMLRLPAWFLSLWQKRAPVRECKR